MELISRRRWTTGVAQLPNVHGSVPCTCWLFCLDLWKTLGQIQPWYPSTKELHALEFGCRLALSLRLSSKMKGRFSVAVLGRSSSDETDFLWRSLLRRLFLVTFLVSVLVIFDVLTTLLLLLLWLLLVDVDVVEGLIRVEHVLNRQLDLLITLVNYLFLDCPRACLISQLVYKADFK